MTNETSTFPGFGEPEIIFRHAYVDVSYLRPDGTYWDGGTYDMLRPCDVATINKNISDGYRVIAITMTLMRQ
jgi:hypothetical protein